MSLKEQLTALSKRLTPVKYPGLDGAFLRRMNGEERTQYCDLCAVAKDGAGYVAAMNEIISLCLCDSTGARQYATPEELKDVAGEIIEELAKEAAVVNGLGPEDPEALEKKVPPATPGVTIA